jgi:L-alanine-DL-glutamate epimerase-like enolase superfamily enzyme
MKITAVETTVIQGNFDWILVRIDTDEGLSGLGEAYWGAGVHEILRSPSIRELLLGRDPRDVEPIFHHLKRRLVGAGSVAGTMVTALSGVEIALWDLAGKAAGLPVYRLLGGMFRDRLRVYADCGFHGWDSFEPARRVAREMLDRGFTALKFDIDTPSPDELDPWNRTLSNPELDRIAGLVGAIRDEIGGGIDLSVDCHWKYNARDALALAVVLAPFRLRWLEDPVPSGDSEAHRLVTARSPVPICSGENRYLKEGFRDLIVDHGADIIAPDVPKMGGLAEAKKVADLADTYSKAVAPHNVSSPLGTIAACHVMATVPNFLLLEYHARTIHWWEDLVDGGAIREGHIRLTEAPGLGVALREDIARAHLKPGAAWFPPPR